MSSTSSTTSQLLKTALRTTTGNIRLTWGLSQLISRFTWKIHKPYMAGVSRSRISPLADMKAPGSLVRGVGITRCIPLFFTHSQYSLAIKLKGTQFPMKDCLIWFRIINCKGQWVNRKFLWSRNLGARQLFWQTIERQPSQWDFLCKPIPHLCLFRRVAP